MWWTFRPYGADIGFGYVIFAVKEVTERFQKFVLHVFQNITFFRRQHSTAGGGGQGEISCRSSAGRARSGRARGCARPKPQGRRFESGHRHQRGSPAIVVGRGQADGCIGKSHGSGHLTAGKDRQHGALPEREWVGLLARSRDASRGGSSPSRSARKDTMRNEVRV